MEKSYISIFEYILSITGFNFLALLISGHSSLGVKAMGRFIVQWFCMAVSFLIINVSMGYIGIIFNHLPMNMWTIILMWHYAFSYLVLSYGMPIAIGRICNSKMMNSLIKYYEEKRVRERTALKQS